MFREKNFIPEDPRISELTSRLEVFLEGSDTLGFDVGEGRDAIKFLAGIDMRSVETLLVKAPFSPEERENIFNLIEEEKGKLNVKKN